MGTGTKFWAEMAGIEPGPIEVKMACQPDVLFFYDILGYRAGALCQVVLPPLSLKFIPRWSQNPGVSTHLPPLYAASFTCTFPPHTHWPIAVLTWFK